MPDEAGAEVDDDLDATVRQDALWAGVSRSVRTKRPIAPDIRPERGSGAELSVEHVETVGSQ
jgi:hypothetical protein